MSRPTWSTSVEYASQALQGHSPDGVFKLIHRTVRVAFGIGHRPAGRDRDTAWSQFVVEVEDWPAFAAAVREELDRVTRLLAAPGVVAPTRRLDPPESAR